MKNDNEWYRSLRDILKEAPRNELGRNLIPLRIFYCFGYLTYGNAIGECGHRNSIKMNHQTDFLAKSNYYCKIQI